MKRKLIPYFRVSSKAQKEEDTKNRQIDNFERAWPQLSINFDIFEKIPGAHGHDRYFIDEAFNLEKWDEATDFLKVMRHCQAGEVHAIFVSEADRLFRSRSNELRGRILDIIRDNRIEVITKSGVISENSIIMEFMSSLSAEDKRGILHKCHSGKITRLEREGRPPTGRSPFCFQWNKDAKKWSVVESEVQLFKSAVSLSIGKIFDSNIPKSVKAIVGIHPEGMNDKKVAETLSSLGFSKRPFCERIKLNQAKAAGKLTSGAIEVMFREDRYRGVLNFKMVSADLVGNQQDKKHAERKTYPVPVDRILEDSVWDELQSRRAARRRWLKYNQTHEYARIKIMKLVRKKPSGSKK
jgi:DNA invertase Pin-like site-specific DNA recombinase